MYLDGGCAHLAGEICPGCSRGLSRDRVMELARYGALLRHRRRVAGHPDPFKTCPHEDCALVRAGASPGASPQEDLRLVLQALVDKIEILGPLVDGYLAVSHVRSGTHYAGPNWIRELANAKAALRHGASPGVSQTDDEDVNTRK